MKHTESAGGIVVNPRKQVVLVNQGYGSWSLPKGKIEADENPLEAAKREIYEETGILNLELVEELGNYIRQQMDIHGNPQKDVFKTIHLFLFRTDQEKLQPTVEDILEARWVDKDEVISLLSYEKDIAFFKKIKNRL